MATRYHHEVLDLIDEILDLPLNQSQGEMRRLIG